jgi:hypothetical protein
MAKKLTFETNLTEGIKMLGLVTHLKDYRLAFFINRKLEIQLKKFADFECSCAKGVYSWYYFSEGSNYPNLTLLSNNHEKGKLIPDFKMDYIILFKQMFDEKLISKYISKLRKIPDLTLVFPLQISKIKNIDSILEANEMHELKQVIRPEKK